MRFIDEVKEYSMDVWRECAAAPFLAEMADGSLSRGKFRDYIIQDSLYLRDYVKVYAYAFALADNIGDMKEYLSCLEFINEGEGATRIVYLKDFGIADEEIDTMPKKRQCADYCRFLIETAKNGGEEEILMAMLPCMLGYHYVFEQLKSRFPGVTEGYYAPLVRDYTTEEYRSSCAHWEEFTERKCAGLSEERKWELKEIFRQASLHELYFWQMAGGE